MNNAKDALNFKAAAVLACIVPGMYMWCVPPMHNYDFPFGWQGYLFTTLIITLILCMLLFYKGFYWALKEKPESRNNRRIAFSAALVFTAIWALVFGMCLFVKPVLIVLCCWQILPKPYWSEFPILSIIPSVGIPSALFALSKNFDKQKMFSVMAVFAVALLLAMCLEGYFDYNALYGGPGDVV